MSDIPVSSVLSVRGLTRTYRDGEEVRTVLRDFNLEALPAQTVALTGPSGSGKSTLLNLLAGILTPDSGRITLRVDGETVVYGDLTPHELTRLRRRRIGYVFQFFNLVPTLTVRENVLLPLELNRCEHLRDEAMARLESLDLLDRMDDFPAHLSGGERQRTAIARALAHRPGLVLADEPTGNLDRENAERVIELLVREVRALSSTLILATHNEAIAERADQLIRLSR